MLIRLKIVIFTSGIYLSSNYISLFILFDKSRSVKDHKDIHITGINDFYDINRLFISWENKGLNR